MQYLVNTPDVVSEIIDGELVAIHLGNGCYYHSNKTGSAIWDLIDNGNEVSEIIPLFSKHFSLEEKSSKKLVESFIKKLAKENLIRPLGKTEKAKSKKTKIKANSDDYEKPTLKKHTDMKELLLLDPIHDIGDEEMPLQTVE